MYRAAATWNTRYANKEAFTALNTSGYKSGNLLGKRYLAHRVIWLLCHKDWPEGTLDHINGIRTDNRLSNLRLATLSENAQNRKTPSVNTSGVMGVYWYKKFRKWVSMIRIAGKLTYLGAYDDFEEAVAARKEAELANGYHPNHGRPGQSALPLR